MAGRDPHPQDDADFSQRTPVLTRPVVDGFNPAGGTHGELSLTAVALEGVPAIRWSYQDVSTPIAENFEECECTDEGPDSNLDLTLKFDKRAIIQAIGEVHQGDTVPLTLTGELSDGTPIEGVDCVVIRGKPGKNVQFAGNDAESSAAILLGNHPNPFNPTTTISFDAAEETDYRLTVYNITGRVVSEFTGTAQIGQNCIQWDATGMASGVYFYKLQAGEYKETKKMVLMK